MRMQVQTTSRRHQTWLTAACKMRNTAASKSGTVAPDPSLAIVNRKSFTLLAITSRLSCCLKLTSFKVFNLDGAKSKITGGRLNMGIRNTVEIFSGQSRRFDDSGQQSASNECVRLIRKLRWIGIDDEAERVLAQLSGWPFRPIETVIAGPWATD